MTAAREKATADVVARIKKCLEMARLGGGSEHETAAAAAMATRLMERYEVDQAMLDTDQPAHESFVRRTIVELNTKMPAWLLSLTGGILRTMGCHASVCSSAGYSRITGTGPADALDRAEIFVHWLRAEVDRFNDAIQPGAGRSYRASFRSGCVSRIVERIQRAQALEREAVRQEARDEEEEEEEEAETRSAPAGFALARVETALDHLNGRVDRAREFLKAQLEAEGAKLGKGRARAPSRSQAGWSAGLRAGDRAAINKPAGRLPG